MTSNRPLNIPMILGTSRKGRMSAHAARFMVSQIEKRQSATTALTALAELPLPIDDAGAAIKTVS